MLNNIEGLSQGIMKHEGRQPEAEKDSRAVIDCGSNQIEYEKSYSPYAPSRGAAGDHSDLDDQMPEATSPPTVKFKDFSQGDENSRDLANQMKKRESNISINNLTSEVHGNNFQTSRSNLSDQNMQVIDD